MRGWVIASSRASAAGSPNTMSPRRLRSSAPSARDDLGPGGGDVGVGGLAGRLHLAREPVGVDDRDAARREHPGHGRLARADSAGEPERP